MASNSMYQRTVPTAHGDRINLRRARADSVAARLLQEIAPYLKDDDREPWRRLASEAMIKLLCDEGVEVLTDHERERLGLPARGPDGWTAEELVALEQQRLEVLSRPLFAPIPAPAKRTD